MDKGKIAEEAHLAFVGAYGIKKISDSEHEMDPEKVSKSLGTKATKATFKDIEAMEFSLDDRDAYPTLFINDLAVYVEDQIISEAILAPSIEMSTSTTILLAFTNFKLRQEGSGVTVTVPFLWTFVNNDDDNNNSPSQLFFDGIIKTSVGYDEYTFSCSEMGFIDNPKKTISRPPNFAKANLEKAETSEFVNFVMGALGIGPLNVLSIVPQIEMKDVLLPLHLCGSDITLNASKVCVHKEKGLIELDNFNIFYEDDEEKEEEMKMKNKLTISINRDTNGIKITADGQVTFKYENVYELWKIINKYFIDVGKTGTFSFEQSPRSNKKCTLILANGAFAEVNGLIVNTSFGCTQDISLNLSFTNIVIKAVADEKDKPPKLILNASISKEKRKDNAQQQQQQQQLGIKLLIKPQKDSGVSNVPAERGVTFDDEEEEGLNAEVFKDSWKSCNFVADISLTTLSIKTLKDFTNIFNAIRHSDIDTLSFVTLTVKQKLTLFVDTNRYITSKSSATVYIRNTPGARPSYLGCFKHMNFYANTDAKNDPFVAVFHRMNVNAERDIPITIYGDSDTLFVDAESSALLVYPEMLSGIICSPFIANKQQIIIKLKRSSLKFCNRTKAVGSLISVGVVAAESIFFKSEKDYSEPLSYLSEPNTKSKMLLDIAGSKLYTVGLLDNMRVPSSDSMGSSSSSSSSPNQDDFWMGLRFRQIGCFDKIVFSMVLSSLKRRSLDISVDEVAGFEMDFHPDTFFPLVDIFRRLLSYVKRSIRDDCSNNNGGSNGSNGSSRGGIGFNRTMVPPSQDFSCSVKPQIYSQSVNNIKYTGTAVRHTHSYEPKESEKFNTFTEFDPILDYHDSNIAKVINDDDDDDDDDNIKICNDLGNVKISVRVEDINEIILRFNSQNAINNNNEEQMCFKGSESMIFSNKDEIYDSADRYYHAKNLPKEAYWFGNITFASSAKMHSQPVKISASSSSEKSQSEKDHLLEITIRKGHFDYVLLNNEEENHSKKELQFKKKLNMWLDSFTAKYDGNVIGESRKDKFTCSYIPGPVPPYVTLFLSYVVPNNLNNSGCGDGEGDLSIYVNPCYISFMKNVFKMFDKYANQRAETQRQQPKKTPNRSIRRITLHPFILNFDWVPYNNFTFANVVTELPFMTFEPFERNWRNVLPEIVKHMREKCLFGLIKSSLITGTNNPMCSVARIIEGATEVVTRPVKGANQGTRNVIMGFIEGTWVALSTFVEETFNMGVMAGKGVYTLYEMGKNRYLGYVNVNEGGNDDNDGDGEEKGPCMKLFESLPFVEEGKNNKY